ncbi:shikimate kinase [Bacteroidota bacterium]|nr:shikimate kinase [Bacteroidota bacterium]
MNKIILIGFMFSGKTSVARILSIKKNIIHMDTDLAIENKFNLKIVEIFDKYGESFFREQESIVLKKIQSLNLNMIISTGGGTPIHSSNMQKLNKIGKTIYLESNFEFLYKNLKRDKESRPLYKMYNKNELSKIYNERIKIYSNAHLKINCSKKSLSDISEEISNFISF